MQKSNATLHRQDMLEDFKLLQSKELRQAEKEIQQGKVHRWENVKREFKL